jgi:hypothetical protein
MLGSSSRAPAADSVPPFLPGMALVSEHDLGPQHARKFRESLPPFQLNRACGTFEVSLPSAPKRFLSIQISGATVAATVRSEYWGHFVSVDVASSRERPHGRSR